jgi:hypothetical protein
LALSKVGGAGVGAGVGSGVGAGVGASVVVVVVLEMNSTSKAAFRFAGAYPYILKYAPASLSPFPHKPMYLPDCMCSRYKSLPDTSCFHCVVESCFWNAKMLFSSVPMHFWDPPLPHIPKNEL